MWRVKIVLLGFFLNVIGGQNENQVISLNEDNFEHQTQASTGATTGDWLVLFVRGDECAPCKEAKEIFSKLNERLSRKLNVAIVDSAKNIGLLRRFGIKKLPVIYFFRHGFQYVYIGELSENKIEKFALGGFQDSLKEPVKKPLSSFDIWKEDTIQEIMMSIKNRQLPSYSTLAIAIGSLVISLAFLLCCCSGSSPDISSKKNQ